MVNIISLFRSQLVYIGCLCTSGQELGFTFTSVEQQTLGNKHLETNDKLLKDAHSPRCEGSAACD